MNRQIFVGVAANVLLGVLILGSVQWTQASAGEVLFLDGIVVDDFEKYSDDGGSRMSETWIDGSVNGTGAMVGHSGSLLVEPRIVHGGKQSMPFRYDNTRSPFYSEIEREFSPVQDWTAGQTDTLSLWVRGDVVSWAEPSPGSFTISGAGLDVWSDNDQFRYVWRKLTGDGSILARIDSMTNTSPHAKAGVMIRESLARNSAHAFMLTKPSSSAFESRMENGSGDCVRAYGWPGKFPRPFWVKLERKGDQFTGYCSTDGIEWIEQPRPNKVESISWPNPRTIEMPTSVHIGLGVCSHDANSLCTATFSHVATTGTLRGQWQMTDVGVDQPGNRPDDLYVIVQDNVGKAIMVTCPNSEIITATAWTEWKIPLSSLAGVDLSRVKKVYVGVGGRRIPIRNGAGRIYIDDIRVLKSEP